MPFVNRIRLPIKVTRPQLVAERDIFRKANGEIKVLSVVIRKSYEGETDLLPEKYHDRLMIALNHDDVRIEGDKYVGDVVQDGDYTINWVDFLDYPIAKASFKIFATPFDASNTNCGTCEDVIQVVTNDDNIGTVEEGSSIEVDVLANDDICCYPVTVTVITTNSDYVQSISVVDNELHIVIKDDVSTQNNVLLATYRAQCENGQYDEANVYADITGSGAAVCQSPTGLQIDSIAAESVTISWDNVPFVSWEWKLYLATDLINPVDTGTSLDNDVTLSGLTPATQYVFTLRTACGGGEFSNYAQLPFTTNPSEGTETCGSYRLCYFNAIDEDPAPNRAFDYMDCNGDMQMVIVANFECEVVCALQNSEGDPVLISPDGPFGGINYEGLC